MVMASDPSSRWWRWHLDYDDPASELSQRLTVVQARLRDAVASAPPGPVRLVSACAGQCRDVVGAVAGHVRAGEVTGRMVERDADNANAARRALARNDLHRIEVVEGDASRTDVYRDVVPADVLLLCGIFGNVSDGEVERTVRNASLLCATGTLVIWTRHRRPPDLTPAIRNWFDESGFEELHFDSPADQSFAVGTHRLVDAPLPFTSGLRLFTFR